MRAELVLTFLAACLAMACAPSGPEIDLDGEEQAIRKLTRDWFADEIRRDMDASLSYLAPDAVIQPERSPTVVGIAAMRSVYEEWFKQPYTDTVMEPRTVVVAASGDLAYDVGSWRMVYEGEEGRTEEPGKSTIIWRKLDGQWKCVVMSYSMDAPVTPSNAIGSTPGAASLAAEDLEAIRRLVDRYAEAARSNDWARLVAFMTEDVVFMRPEAPALKGRAAVLEWLTSIELSLRELSLEVEEIDGRDDLAYVLAPYVQTFTVGGSLELHRTSGEDFGILRKQSDGSWLISRWSGSEDQPSVL